MKLHEKCEECAEYFSIITLNSCMSTRDDRTVVTDQRKRLRHRDTVYNNRCGFPRGSERDRQRGHAVHFARSYRD